MAKTLTKSEEALAQALLKETGFTGDVEVSMPGKRDWLNKNNNWGNPMENLPEARSPETNPSVSNITDYKYSPNIMNDYVLKGAANALSGEGIPATPAKIPAPAKSDTGPTIGPAKSGTLIDDDPEHITFSDFVRIAKTMRKKASGAVEALINSPAAFPLGNVPPDPKMIADTVHKAVVADTEGGDWIYNLLSDPEFAKIPLPQQIETFAGQDDKFNGLSPQEFWDYRIQHGFPAAESLKPDPRSQWDKGIDVVEPIAQDIAMGAGAAYGGPFGMVTGPAAGAAVGMGMEALRDEEESDFLARKLGVQPGTAGARFLNSVQTMGVNKGVQRGIPAAGKAIAASPTGQAAIKAMEPIVAKAKPITDPAGRAILRVYGLVRGSGASNYPLLDASNAPMSMYRKYSDTRGGVIPRMAEEVFAPGMRRRAEDAMDAKVGRDLESEIRQLSGLAPHAEVNTNALAKMAQHDIDSGVANIREEAYKSFDTVIARGGQNPSETLARAPKSLARPKNPDVTITYDAEDNATINPRVIDGFIETSQTGATVKQLLLNKQKGFRSTGLPNDDDQLVKFAQFFNKLTQGGKRALSPQEILDMREQAELLGYSGIMSDAQLTPLVKEWRSIINAIDNDAFRSIGKWQNDVGGKALKAYDDFRTLLASSHDLYGDPKSTLHQLINDDVAPFEWITKIVNNPNEIVNALKTKSVTAPSGKLINGGSKIKELLQAYKLNELLESSSIRDTITGERRIDARLLTDELDKWKASGAMGKLWDTPDKEAALRATAAQLSKAGLSSSEAAVSKNMQRFATYRQGIIVGKAVLGGALVGGDNMISGVLGNTAPIVGLYFGGKALTRIMSSNTMARRWTNFMENRALGISTEQFQKDMFSVLNGTVQELMHEDGSMSPVYVKDNKLKPLSDQEAMKLRAKE